MRFARIHFLCSAVVSAYKGIYIFTGFLLQYMSKRFGIFLVTPKIK